MDALPPTRACLRRCSPRPIALAMTSAAAILIVPAQAGAQTLSDDYWINVMAFAPKIDTNVRVQTKTDTIVGTDIDFENDLAMDNDEVLPSVSIGSRFGRVIVNADFYKLKRSGSTSLRRDITFDDVTYPASAQIGSSFDSDIYRLTVGYAFVQNETLELGAGLGLHATRFDLSIEGEASVGSAGASTEVRRRDFLAPLPTLGAFATYRLSDRIEANARLDYLSLKIGDYDGKLVNAQASVSYQIVRHVSLGVAYRYVDYRVGVDKDLWSGRVRYKLHGPAFILQGSF